MLLVIIFDTNSLNNISMKSVITTIALSLLLVFTLFANDTNPIETDRSIPIDNCFFIDPDEKIIFIDFEEINGFAKEIVIKNERNEIIFSEQLWDKFDLNGNIYEWNFSEELAANFKIELFTFTKVLKLEITKDNPLVIN